MKVILCEKHQHAKTFFEALQVMQPDEPVFIVCTMGITPFRPIYPKNIKHKDFPLIVDATYAPDRALSGYKFGFTSGYEFQKSPGYQGRISYEIEDCHRIIGSADEVIFGCDPDLRGVFSFEQFIHTFAPAKSGSVFPACFLSDCSLDGFLKMMGKMTDTDNNHYRHLKNAAKVKRHFEFNFNINSTAIFSPIFHKINSASESKYFSKYQLQLLYWLRECDPISEDMLPIHMDRRWTGTGKYSLDEYIKRDNWGLLGSPSSYRFIIKDLQSKGMICTAGGEVKDAIVSVTELGKKFLDCLHPDCKDLDLPFRLESWMREPFEVIKPKIDTYLKRFFSKQLRFKP